MADERELYVEYLERIFVSQKEFGDYKETMAKAVGDIRGSVRAVKWISGIVLAAIAVEIIVTLLRAGATP